ncbi:uncharacterized protein LOC111716654 [Eurytemora carolleeae]|uniref:uncharacterized protein LOC111716654 n=1 Tax=Eurytemora carolleeae TaxID=1294199 RepID=UPI000C790A9D|nr:uncharacterized protein LOC111716654 [Eurytemora carolleeae]XP_023347906.1 uncharacterized protein LOC111716654 [Eurytemora carolleeae]|eukprot:XP_023347905.1 uncharacterized protein LOC111716654 [Eurytemora affinis]
MRNSVAPLFAVLSLVLVSSQDINFGDSKPEEEQEGDTQTDTRLLGIIPGITSGNAETDNLINGGLLGAGLVGGAGLLTGAIQIPCGRRKRQADGTNTKFFGNNCNNPCGRRKKRQADNEEDDTVNERFFLPGGNNNCGGGFNTNSFGNNGGFNNGGFNNGGFNNGGFNNGGFNNNNGGFNNGGFNNNNGGFNNGGFNNGGFNNGGFNNNGGLDTGCGCQCRPDIFFESNGRIQGNCRTPDSTGRLWCYTTGYEGTCGDLQPSKRFPQNPWSYNACNAQLQCRTTNSRTVARDCKGRPKDDEYFGCGCENRRKRQLSFGGDQSSSDNDRCAEAALTGRIAQTPEK